MKKRITVILIILTGLLSEVHAKVNTDSIFERAILLAKNQHFNLAIIDAKKALSYNTKRGDIMVFLANAYSMDNKTDTAFMFIRWAKEIGYHNDDYYETWTNILLRDHQYIALLHACNEAEKQKYPDIEDLFRKRLIAYTELRYYDYGIHLIEEPQNKGYLNDKKINEVYSYLIYERNVNTLSVNYALNMFDKGYIPQHLASLGYSLRIGENSLGLVANYINQQNLNYVQLKANFHISLGEEQSIYFNYGYAYKASLFPQHQGSFEYYVNFPDHIESSFGARFMNYEKLNTNLFILTAQIDKYLENNWFAIRPYYVFNISSKKKSFSLMNNYRLFGSNEFDFWGIEIDYGNMPDDLYSTTQVFGFSQLTSYKIKIEKNFRINRISGLDIGVGYSNEELKWYLYRNRLSVDVGYKIRLR